MNMSSQTAVLIGFQSQGCITGGTSRLKPASREVQPKAPHSSDRASEPRCSNRFDSRCTNGHRKNMQKAKTLFFDMLHR